MLNNFRLILDPPRSAALNMAIDQFLMGSQDLPDASPVLRFYSWSQPAYSIGYFQKIREIAKLIQPANKNVSIVRRITGGGLVAHGTDITFSLAVKNDSSFFKGDAKDSYLKVNEALRVGLKPLYPEIDYADCKTIPLGRGGKERACFDSPVCYDLLIKGKKTVGASQRRKSKTILHQSSIFLDGDQSDLRRHLLNGFREKWKIGFFEKPLSAAELLSAGEIEKKRYASEDWSFLERSFLS